MAKLRAIQWARWAFVVWAGLVALPAQAEPRHGMSSFGDLKYGPDFKHFDYVNPDAPKGGALSYTGEIAYNTFDSLNPFILKGLAPEGMPAYETIPSLIWDSLMTPAYDEPDAVYGLIAKTVDIAPDNATMTFVLRPEARFQDGSPVTAEDVVFSFETISKKGRPDLRLPLAVASKAEALNKTTVRFTLKPGVTRNEMLSVAGLSVLSKAYFTKHKFEETTIEQPLASGPYKVGKVDMGRSVTYVRDPKYWGRDLPVNKGRFNFDQITLHFFRDRIPAQEAFKAGQHDFRFVFSARAWVEEFDFPAAKEGLVKRVTFPDLGRQGFYGININTRRPYLSDVRVRKALDYALDFEWMNKTLMLGQYERSQSAFNYMPYQAKGLPSPAELKLLEPWRGKVPDAVFGPMYQAPKTDGTGTPRESFREADRLLKEAGWGVKDGKRVNAQGEVLKFEIISNEPSTERTIGPFIANLKKLGIDANFRALDTATDKLRSDTRDFDGIIANWIGPTTPGGDLEVFFGSQAARTEGSQNLAGISDPAIDDMIAKARAATNRDEFYAAIMALDRLLMHGHYIVPFWGKKERWGMAWDRFGRPAVPAGYYRGVMDTWWVDAEKAKVIDAKLNRASSAGQTTATKP